MDGAFNNDNDQLRRLFSRLRRDILAPIPATTHHRLFDHIKQWLETDDGQAFTEWATTGSQRFGVDQFIRIDTALREIEHLADRPSEAMTQIINPLLDIKPPIPLGQKTDGSKPPYWFNLALLPEEALEGKPEQGQSDGIPRFTMPDLKFDLTPPPTSPQKKPSVGKKETPIDPGAGTEASGGRTFVFKHEPTTTPKKPKAPANMPSSYAKLERMIGLESVKQAIMTRANTFKANRERERQGGKALSTSMHMVFTGNPGTGKTETAKIVGEIYRDLGLLSKGTFTSTTPADLIVGYVRQTGENTRKKIEEAVGGVLFIDEAYGLVKKDDSGRDFGPEAVEELLVGMEGYRDDLVVILAGYAKEMQGLIKSNPGFESRVRTFIDFPDYKPTELQAIFMKMCQDGKLKLDSRAKKKLGTTVKAMYDQRGATFGNGREVRNLLDLCIERQSNRLYGSGEEYDEAEIWVLTEDDIPDAAELK